MTKTAETQSASTGGRGVNTSVAVESLKTNANMHHCKTCHFVYASVCVHTCLNVWSELRWSEKLLATSVWLVDLCCTQRLMFVEQSTTNPVFAHASGFPRHLFHLGETGRVFSMCCFCHLDLNFCYKLNHKRRSIEQTRQNRDNQCLSCHVPSTFGDLPQLCVNFHRYAVFTHNPL